MKLRQYIHVNNDCYKAGKPLQVKGFMLHSTGANNPYLSRYVGSSPELGINKYNNHWNTPRPDGMQKCVHGFIGKMADESIATCQTLPWDMRGWHCGGKGNDLYIGVEICEDDLSNQSYFMACYTEAVQLVQSLREKFGFDADNIIDHAEAHKRGLASNHADVKHWFSRFGVTMDDFRQSVVNAIENPTPETMLYRIRTSWDNEQSQVGAYRNLESAKKVCDDKNEQRRLRVFDENGKEVY